jgi:hypothetical protein
LDYQDSGITEGQYFASLTDDDARREYLKIHDIRVEKAPKLDGMPGARLMLNGKEVGVMHLDSSCEDQDMLRLLWDGKYLGTFRSVNVP